MTKEIKTAMLLELCFVRRGAAVPQISIFHR